LEELEDSELKSEIDSIMKRVDGVVNRLKAEGLYKEETPEEETEKTPASS
jgi:hypothetical protein